MTNHAMRGTPTGVSAPPNDPRTVLPRPESDYCTSGHDGERFSISDDLAGERRSGGSGQLNRMVRADHVLATRHEHRLEVACPSLKQLALAGRLFHEDFGRLA